MTYGTLLLERAVESQSGISQNSYETGEDVNEGRREDDEAAENIIERADDQDSHVANEHLMDVAEEDTTTSGSIEDNMSLANEGRGEGANNFRARSTLLGHVIVQVES